jgi:hypothetical protein
MAYARPHTHKCSNRQLGCTATICCTAEVVRNYDGWPEALCVWELYDDPMYCEDCVAGPVCADCGRPEHLGHSDGCVSAPIGTQTGSAGGCFGREKPKGNTPAA